MQDLHFTGKDMRHDRDCQCRDCFAPCFPNGYFDIDVHIDSENCLFGKVLIVALMQIDGFAVESVRFIKIAFLQAGFLRGVSIAVKYFKISLRNDEQGLISYLVKNILKIVCSSHV
ncbi:hypothetical protein, partial [Phascolarctobacterium sp.]